MRIVKDGDASRFWKICKKPMDTSCSCKGDLACRKDHSSAASKRGM